MQILKFRRKLSDKEIARLEKYQRRKEREPPLAFEGRVDILNEILGQVEDRLDATDTVSRTFVIQGPPGCGKTSLLAELASKIDQYAHARVVSIETTEMNTPALFVERFVDGLVKRYDKKAFRSSAKTNKTTANATVFKRETEWKSTLPSVIDLVASRKLTIWKALNELLNLKDNPVFLLLVDEVQSLSPFQGSDTNAIAKEVHLGTTGGIKIIPVFAGLSDCQNVLKEVGVSLRTHVESLGGLSEPEAESVVWNTMKGLGVEDLFNRTDVMKIMEQCSFASEQWPRHLDQYLKALTLEISACKDAFEIDLDKVIQSGHENRMNHYDDQLSSLKGDDLVETLIGIAQQYPLNTPIYRREVRTFLDDDPFVEDDSKNVLFRLLHHGVLEDVKGTASQMRFSIPSLHTYLANECNHEKVLSVMNQTMQERLNESKSKGTGVGD